MGWYKIHDISKWKASLARLLTIVHKQKIIWDRRHSSAVVYVFSLEKRDGLRRNSQYPPTVEDIPRMLTMCTKRIWKSETKGYSSTFWRKRLYFEKILKQKSREERWVDMKFTISSASGRHPSPLLAASHSSWAAKPLLYSTKLHPFHSHLIIPIHNCFMWNNFTGTGYQSSGTE